MKEGNLDQIGKVNMQVNFVGNTLRGYVGETADEVHLVRDLERVGNDVRFIPRDVWKAHVDGIKEYVDYEKWNQYLSDIKADINIICKWTHFDKGKYITQLKKESGAPVFYWVWDFMADDSDDSFNLKMAREADLYLSNEGGAFPWYISKGVKPYYFPMDVCDGDLPVFENEKKIYDVVFPGSFVRKGDRIEYLKEINKEIPIKIFSWNHEEWVKEGFDASPAVYGADFNKMVAQSKIILGFNVEPHCWGYWSNRVGKVLRAGGLLIQQYAPGMEILLHNELSSLTFTSPEQAINKIKTCLEDESWVDTHIVNEERGFTFTSLYRCMQLNRLITNYLKEGTLWNQLH